MWENPILLGSHDIAAGPALMTSLLPSQIFFWLLTSCPLHSFITITHSFLGMS